MCMCSRYSSETNEDTKNQRSAWLLFFSSTSLLFQISIERKIKDFPLHIKLLKLPARMDLKPARQFDYLQRTLSIFLSNPSDMSEQFEQLINDLIQENKQINRSPKNSPESSSSDSKPELPTASNSPQPLPKKRSAPVAANSKPPPSKRLKSVTIKDEDEDDEIPAKKKLIQSEDKPSTTEKEEDINDDEEDTDDIKSKPSESRDIDEFAIELGLVCSKCMVLTEEKDNRLVECHECHAKYHQKCHKPPVSTADISDPRCLWYCSKCKKLINKKQQSQSSLKETKPNSNNPSALNNKSKSTEPTLITGKKGLSNSNIDVTTGLFSFKPKSSDSITSDNNTSINTPSISSSNSSLSNGTTTKNTNGWASLATGFKEKKVIPEVTTPTPTSSATSILSELSVLIGPSNSNNIKRSPPSPKPIASSSPSSFNPLLKQSTNGPTSGSLKSISSSSLSSVKPNKPSSPPVLKPQLSASSLKPTPKLLPTSKTLQRISSPTPLGRQTSTVKSPPSATTPTYNRLNSSGSNSSGSNSPSSANTNAKIATSFDYDKRIKQMKKLAAEKSLTKKC